MNKNLRPYLLILILVASTITCYGQFTENKKWKALFAVGINYPTTDGFVKSTYAQPVNFPTINIGIQHMFKRQYGARLDFGFNRFKNDEDSPEFKINYTRINAQFVYDPTEYLRFLPEPIHVGVHAGPGLSFAKPLRGLDENKQTYLNLNLGAEIHYAINRKVSVYTDVSYIYGFTSLDDYDPILDGLGAFNGSVLNVTFGLSVSLSGCQYCD